MNIRAIKKRSNNIHMLQRTHIPRRPLTNGILSWGVRESHQILFSHLPLHRPFLFDGSFATTFVPLFVTFFFSLPSFPSSRRSDGPSDRWGLSDAQSVGGWRRMLHIFCLFPMCRKQLCRFIRTSPGMALGGIRRSSCCSDLETK